MCHEVVYTVYGFSECWNHVWTKHLPTSWIQIVLQNGLVSTAPEVTQVPPEAILRSVRDSSAVGWVWQGRMRGWHLVVLEDDSNFGVPLFDGENEGNHTFWVIWGTQLLSNCHEWGEFFRGGHAPAQTQRAVRSGLGALDFRAWKTQVAQECFHQLC